ncbi:MAG: DUF5793 family protein [Haloarculaceae archaeon]|jgi:hypothetical protein
MRRDHFTLAVEHVDSQSTDPPTLAVLYEGPAGNLTARLTATGEAPGSEDVDSAFRLQGPVAAEDSPGVFSLSRRLTGEYLLEAKADAAAVRALIDAARERGGSYRIRIERPGADDIVLDKETLLVYDPDGNLLRQESLIPSGVEL